MAVFKTPGIFVEETGFHTHAIAGVPTGTAGFVGTVGDGAPDVAAPVVATREFALNYPAAAPALASAVAAFFDNGGKRLFISAAATPDAAGVAAALAALPEVDVVAAPGLTEPGIAAALIAHVEEPGRYRFALIDPPPGLDLAGVGDFRAGLECSHAALYWPWVVTPAGPVAPSGFIAGLFNRTDIERGVWKAPANEVVRGATGFEHAVDDGEQDVLNPLGINCLRSFPGRGPRVWGARTLSSDPDWKYVNVRRQLDWLEHSVEAGLQWAVFEPNGQALWNRVRDTVRDFLHQHWIDGALLGIKPEQAFFVLCDRTTMSQNDLENGRLIVEVGVAPLRPAEFVTLRIGLWTADWKG